jgi:hypothetical protein
MSRLRWLPLLVAACAPRPLDLPAPPLTTPPDLASPVDASVPPDLPPPPLPDLVSAPDLLSPSPCAIVHSFAAGNSPVSIAVGDLNHDGKLDVVAGDWQTVAYSDSGMSVLLGRGDGTLSPATAWVVASAYVADVALADLDGDGNLDIVASSDTKPVVSVLFGDGNGHAIVETSPWVSSAAGPGPHGLAIGDFNGDGQLDLATANPTQISPYQDTSVLLNRGTRAFTSPKVYQVAYLSLSIITGDFNGDGRLDLVRDDPFPNGNVTAAGRIALLSGRGDGSFNPPAYIPVGPHAGALAAKDLDGDGKLDLVAASYNDDSIAVMMGNGDGSFAKPRPLAQPKPRFIAIADWNRDGRPDLLVGGDMGVALFLGQGNGMFGVPSQCAVGKTYQLATGDFDGDGQLDIATANLDDNVVRVLLR